MKLTVNYVCIVRFDHIVGMWSAVSNLTLKVIGVTYDSGLHFSVHKS